MNSEHKEPNIPGRVTGIQTETILLDEPFIDVAARFASIPGTVALMSGGDNDSAGRHILGVMPWLTFSGRRRNMSIEMTGRPAWRFDGDPFETARYLLDRFKMPEGQTDSRPSDPFQCGLMGYLAYDLKNSLETLPVTAVDDLNLPHILFFAPSIILTHDISKNITELRAPILDVPGVFNVGRRMEAFKKIMAAPHRDPGFSGDGGEFKSNFIRPDYLDSIKKIKDYIAAGHVYQINMSQRFETGFSGDGFSLFKHLFSANPAPFFAYVNGGDHQVISTSPERFIKQDKEAIETRPIKGTRPRGKTPAEDEAFRMELTQSQKDDAELSMIVDLLRNDIGKVCVARSVKVTSHKRVEAYENVWHLVSIIEGIRDSAYDSIDVLKAAFPGGSITGCPKIRAMEIIDELEPSQRHIYTGSIGYISFHDSMDFSIAIRTATLINDRIIFSVGGGVVYDSDPQDEYDETLHKGKTLMDAFKKGSDDGSGDGPGGSSWVWMNGSLKPMARTRLPILDQGLLYGHGFFETIKVAGKKPERLSAHIQRFNRAWVEFFPGSPIPDFSWDIIIDRVIEKNRLENQTAAVKILATRGQRDKAPFDHALIVSARPYVHRLTTLGQDGKAKPGLDLITYPEPRQTPLAAHKTLNYLYYLMAGKWARENGGDEAVILNPDFTVSETNTGNILMIKGKRIVRPASPFALPGTMEQATLDDFAEKGFEIVTRPVDLDDLRNADHVLVTNSLMGAVFALGLDGEAFGNERWRTLFRRLGRKNSWN